MQIVGHSSIFISGLVDICTFNLSGERERTLECALLAIHFFLSFFSEITVEKICPYFWRKLFVLLLLSSKTSLCILIKVICKTLILKIFSVNSLTCHSFVFFHVLIFFGYIHTSGISGSCGGSNFKFLHTFHAEPVCISTNSTHFSHIFKCIFWRADDFNCDVIQFLIFYFILYAFCILFEKYCLVSITQFSSKVTLSFNSNCSYV